MNSVTTEQSLQPNKPLPQKWQKTSLALLQQDIKAHYICENPEDNFMLKLNTETLNMRRITSIQKIYLHTWQTGKI